MRTSVIVKFDMDGFHYYPNAPQEVRFLQNPHRHTFAITAAFRVTDLNREIEIFIMRNKMQQFLSGQYGNPCHFGSMSCEMIAAVLVDKFMDYGLDYVEVWEEATGGARIEL